MKVRKTTVHCGADVTDIDISKPLSESEVSAIRQALMDNLVLFFRNQPKFTVEQHVRFARYFGEIDLPAFRTTASIAPEILMLDQISPKGNGGDSWHADVTYMPAPPMASILQAHILPSVGGDTCFASMYAAYDALAPQMRTMLDSLYAVHSLAQMAERTKHLAGVSIKDQLDKNPPFAHPVIIVHPETGRKALNVNANWTTHIEGMGRAESEALLNFLFNHIRSPEYQVRLRWNVGDVAFWDNRSVQHYAVADYNERRLMQRVTISGAPLVGIVPARTPVAA